MTRPRTGPKRVQHAREQQQSPRRQRALLARRGSQTGRRFRQLHAIAVAAAHQARIIGGAAPVVLAEAAGGAEEARAMVPRKDEDVEERLSTRQTRRENGSEEAIRCKAAPLWSAESGAAAVNAGGSTVNRLTAFGGRRLWAAIRGHLWRRGEDRERAQAQARHEVQRTPLRQPQWTANSGLSWSAQSVRCTVP